MTRCSMQVALLKRVVRVMLSAHRVVRAESPQFKRAFQVAPDVLSHVDETAERPLGS